MPTENRSSNTEQMVSLPRERLEQLRDSIGIPLCKETDELEAWVNTLLAQSVVQHQGEPAGWTYEGGKEFTACPDHAHDLRAEGIELSPVYRHPPTSDGFSAGDMADQGAKAFRDGQQSAIPEGFALVPKEMLLSKEVIGVINFHCGDAAEEEGGQFGQYTDGRLWVGNVTDDDGNQVHGLHIMTDEYPEEGSTTLVEFPAALGNNPA